MLRIDAVKPGQLPYYFSTVAETAARPQGLVEPDPYWLGRGSADLGLHGVARFAEVSAVLSALDPATGEELQGSRRVKNLAQGLVFSVPKSVSLAHALARPEAAERLRAAHDAAVQASLAFAEREYLRAERTEAGSSYQVRIDAAIACAFTHRTSRSDDPHLHTHVLVANLCQGGDGKWSALSADRLYSGSRALRTLFEAELRHQLTSRGVPLGEMRGVYADLAGIDRQTVAAFSKRSKEIADARARGQEAERPRKNLETPYEELQELWRERAWRMGVSASRLDYACGLVAHVPLGVSRRPSTRELTERAASGLDGGFSVDDLLVARAALAPAGVPIEQAFEEVQAVLSSPEVIPARAGPTGVARPTGVAHRADRRRFTTLELSKLSAERAARVAALAGRSGLVVARYEAGDRLAAVEAVVARAGDVRAAGGSVLAVAPGRQAALGVEAVTGIDAVVPRRSVVAISAMKPGDEVVLADCHGLFEAELSNVLQACIDRGIRPVLLASAAGLERTRLLDVVVERSPGLEFAAAVSSPLDREPAREWEFGPATSAVLAGGPDAGIDEAVARAARSAAVVETLLVVPDRALGRVAKERLAASPEGPADRKQCRVVEPRTAAELVRSGATPALVLLGGSAPLGVSADALASLQRTHVLVATDRSGGGDLGWVGEQVRPRHLTEALGAVPSGHADRLGWRRSAARLEAERERSPTCELSPEVIAEARALGRREAPERPGRSLGSDRGLGR